MAFATGSINFKAAPVPGNSSIITLNDGQGAVGSKLQIGFLPAISSSGHTANAFVSGIIEGQVSSGHSSGTGHKIRAGNASNLVTLYLTGNTAQAAFFDFKLGGHGDENISTWRDNFAADGDRPAVLVFRQPGFNDLTIDFLNLSSGFTSTSGLGSYGRKNAAGDYSVNMYSPANLVTPLNTIRAILNAASTAGEIDVKNQTANPSTTSNYQRIMEDRKTNAANVMSLACEVSGGASAWTTATSTFMTVVPLNSSAANIKQAAVTASNEVVYANRGGYRTGGTDALSNAELATYVGKVINASPIRISASFSGANVLLTHTVDGGTGDVSITKADNNITVVGMAGGAPSDLDGEVTGTIGTSGGLVQAGNTVNNPSAQVNIPDSSLGGNTSIVVTILSQSATVAAAASDVKSLADAPDGAKTRSDVIRFLPHGQTFSKPVILSWNITGSTSSIKIFRRANASSAWSVVDAEDYSFNAGKVHVTSSTFSDYMAVGGGAVPITRIGSKLLADTGVTTTKVATNAAHRDDFASSSVQVTHFDLSAQGRNDHVDLLADDRFIAGDATNNSARAFTFAQLETALSLSAQAAGNAGALQWSNDGFDGIAKITSDGVNLTASAGSKLVFAYTGISGSTAAMSASSKTAFRLDSKAKIELAINGANELVLDASKLEPEVSNGLDLGSSSKLFNNIYGTTVSGTTVQAHTIDADKATLGDIDVTSVSGSGTSQFHKIDVDEGTFNRAIATVVSGTTVQAHTVDADKGTLNDVDVTSVSGSGTSQIHKVDVDEGTFNRLIGTVVSGTTVQSHTVDSDKATVGQVTTTRISGSGASSFHKVTGTGLPAALNKLISTNITSSGTTQLHNVQSSTFSGSVATMHKIVADHVDARKINSNVTTEEHFEVVAKQFIPAVSSSNGPSAEGAGLQIGGSAGTGSAGIASVVIGDAGSGIGQDLLFKLGSTQAGSLRVTLGGGTMARFSITGGLSASIGVFNTLTVNTDVERSTLSGSKLTTHTISGTLVNLFDGNIDRMNVNDLDGTSAVFTTVSGTTVQAHTVDADKVTVNDASGNSATLTTTVSGTTVQAHTVDADKGTLNDVDVTSISGSGTSTLHQVQSDVLSGSKSEIHVADIDKITVSQYTGNDTIKKVHLNPDIVRDVDNGHGGLTFAAGQFTIGWHRRIFSRSSKSLVNRSQPTQGSGSLYTTCSLPSGVIIASGSERVYFNGLLLTDGNSTAGNPRDADYNIDYNSTNGPVNVYLHESLTMDSDDVVVVQYLSGANPA